MIRRLLATYACLTLLVLIGLAVPLGYVYARSEEQRAFAQLEHDTEILAAFVDAALSQNRADHVPFLAHETARRLGARIDVVDVTGRSLARTHPPGDDPAAAADLRSALAGRGAVTSGITEVAGERAMAVAVAIHPGNPYRGALRVSVPTAALTDRVHQFWTVLAVVCLVVLAAGALVATALARWIARPLRTLERATRHLADGDTPPSLPTGTGPPELRRLAATFNATATRLDELITAQRSFAGHASHQLKTPLAALRLRLENLEPDIAAAGEANLTAALVETDRLAALVDTLLAMARSEYRTLPREPVDVGAAAAERAALWRPLARKRGITIRLAGPQDSRVYAIPGAVEQILDNLLSNALTAAPPGGTVTATWRPAAGVPAMTELHVADDGPGLTGEQRALAAEPFWRAPDAPAGGTGLGLALVRKLAEGGGGRLRLEQAAPHGLDAVVVLPAAPADARNLPADDQVPAGR